MTSARQRGASRALNTPIDPPSPSVRANGPGPHAAAGWRGTCPARSGCPGSSTGPGRPRSAVEVLEGRIVGVLMCRRPEPRRRRGPAAGRGGAGAGRRPGRGGCGPGRRRWARGCDPHARTASSSRRVAAAAMAARACSETTRSCAGSPSSIAAMARCCHSPTVACSARMRPTARCSSSPRRGRAASSRWAGGGVDEPGPCGARAQRVAGEPERAQPPGLAQDGQDGRVSWKTTRWLTEERRPPPRYQPSSISTVSRRSTQTATGGPIGASPSTSGRASTRARCSRRPRSRRS